MKFEFKCLQNKENEKDRKEEKEKRKKPITPNRPVSTGPDYLLQFSRSRTSLGDRLAAERATGEKGQAAE
jgi:hypothetical protein